MQRLKHLLNSSAAAVHHKEDSSCLELDHISVDYDGRPALEDVSFKLDHGLRVAVVGPNGAGKSTLFNVVSGVMAPAVGRVLVHGHDPSLHVCIAYVTQNNPVNWHFPASVRDAVMMGRVGVVGLFKRPSAADWRLVDQSLERVRLGELAQRQIGELSGGQKQRMFIARALAQEADLILMDESLAGLDIQSQDGVLGVLDDLKEQGVTILFATHDLSLAGEHFDRVLLLNRRLIALGSPAKVLTTENLSQAYGSHAHIVDTAQGPLLIGDGDDHMQSGDGTHA